MKKILVSLFAISCLFTACSDDDNNNSSGIDNLYIFGTLSDEDVAALPVVPKQSIADVGAYPPDMAMAQNYGYVVDSGNNAIVRVDLEKLTIEKAFIDLGQDAAPYAVHADDKYVYAALQGTKKGVKVFSAQTKELAATLGENAINPTAVQSDGNLIFVADSEYDYSKPAEAGTGKIYVYGENFALASTLVSSAKNPSFLDIYKTQSDTYLISVESGIITWGDPNIPPAQSCVDIWNLKEIDISQGIKKRSYCTKNASLGRTAIIGDKLYVGDALKPVVHKLDLAKLDSADFEQITISEASTALTVPLNVDNHLVVFDYNSDTMIWFDDDNSPVHFQLSPSAASKKGPMDAVYDSARKQILIMNSTSGSIDVLLIRNS